jgi:hypothetical protein
MRYHREHSNKPKEAHPCYLQKEQKITPALEEVHELFERWRKDKTGRDPIPGALWEAAISLTDGYFVNKIARRLRVNHNDLKNRARSHITFIELPVTGTSNAP